MNGLIFLVGLLIGWVIGYLWQHKRPVVRDTGRSLQRELADAQSKIRELKSQLARYEQQAEQLKTYEAELQTKTEELQTKTEESQHLTDQLAAAEKQIETLREQLAAAETKARPVAETTPAVEVSEEISEEAAAAVQPDNLRKLTGIGPKVATILNESGIQTFEQLAQTEVSRLRAILEKAGPGFKGMSPESWGEQARLAAKADWKELKKLQKELGGGRSKS